jgi:hypothetical protein
MQLPLWCLTHSSCPSLYSIPSNRLKADILRPTMQTLPLQASFLSLLRLLFQHLPWSRSQQMSRFQMLPLLLTLPLITPPLPPPETNQEHTITALPATPTYPTTQTFTTLTHQRPQTPQERVITARLQQARAQYKTNVAELKSLKAQMAELKRAKKGKGKGGKAGYVCGGCLW